MISEKRSVYVSRTEIVVAVKNDKWIPLIEKKRFESILKGMHRKIEAKELMRVELYSRFE